MIRILAFCGSLRANSSNRAVVEAARQLACGPVSVDVYEGLGALPHYNPDLEAEPLPEPVRALRRQVREADALLVCSPEYARGVAGVMKNGLDWLVGGDEFPHKPVAVINASPRSSAADAAIRLTLATMAGRLVEAASITLPLLGRSIDAAGILADPSLAGPLEAAVAALASAAKSG